MTFPVPAPASLSSSQVNFAADETSVTLDDNAACTGTVSEPTAPTGEVCLYVQALGPGVGSIAGYGELGPHGFFVYAVEKSVGNNAARGTWAYKAP